MEKTAHDLSGPARYQAWARSGKRSASPMIIRRMRNSSGCMTSARWARAKTRRSRSTWSLYGMAAISPPLAELLSDTEELRTQTDDMIETYLSGDRRGAWSAFTKSANIHLPDELFEAMFGGQIEGQAAADEHFAFAHMERPTTFWKPDLSALRDTGVNLIIGIGEQSANELCDRTSRALADEIGIAPTMFPGGHLGLAEDAAAFARRLRDVLEAV